MPNMPARLDDPLRGKKTGKWTKYGGAISGLKKERIEDHWFCQICGETVPEEIKPFLMEMFPGDYIRICPKCTNTASKKTYYEVEQIIHIVRFNRD
jgi:rubredoxin